MCDELFVGKFVAFGCKHVGLDYIVVVSVRLNNNPTRRLTEGAHDILALRNPFARVVTFIQSTLRILKDVNRRLVHHIDHIPDGMKLLPGENIHDCPLESRTPNVVYIRVQQESDDRDNRVIDGAPAFVE